MRKEDLLESVTEDNTPFNWNMSPRVGPERVGAFSGPSFRLNFGPVSQMHPDIPTCKGQLSRNFFSVPNTFSYTLSHQHIRLFKYRDANNARRF
jgi:hypothetical protein